jgi:RNA polymerase sigma-70 factor, ECF subfamily
MADGRDDWDEWLGQYGPALLLFARQFSSGQADAEDLVQEAFIRFWHFRNSAADPKAYLFSCLRNCALELHRSERRLKAREQAVRMPLISDALFQKRMEDDERRGAIEAALNVLPDEQREVVVMKIWGELTFPQIAEVLGVPVDTAASRYRYALQSLRGALSREVAR